MLVELFLFAGALLLYWAYTTRSPAGCPPSPPFRLPFLGHIHYLIPYGSKRVNEGLEELYEKYSRDGAFTFHLGSLKMVLIGQCMYVCTVLRNPGVAEKLGRVVAYVI